ncbi:alanine/glycine:cation symporter family protein [Alloalcanivorax xenomutans]|jgi:alanine or glycine:cation symporter, AGCS family|uniref:alanine/glycine:cation symporter family protein n=1 Tax=Alloalcanivorax xenomutans TaxID=1094342 RepID=UPI00047A40C3|nr:amino acid carrier protein [Alloalcanivorax xenomutans]KYZ87208.1 sodium/alanine symporter [Alcanivorax sp. KX64203]MCE7525901.1 amino acid carrier protein [Alloalcanivorax xenomutans]WOD29796.1 amino acid carrier protein [Alloalcanivorax xenomutans]
MDESESQLELILGKIVGFVWGPPLVTLLVGGGLFFLLYSRLLPYRHLGRGLRLLFKPPDHDDQGSLSHFQALSTALSGTLGMGNVGGVAVAIATGGPGAIFWMWMSALLGIATKFYTCTLAVMYRGKDSEGTLQGGPMYIIREGMGRRWRPLAYFFAFAGLLGTMPIFQVNQLVQVVRDVIATPAGWTTDDQHFLFDLGLGALLAILVLGVVAGKLPRLARVTSTLVPAMVLSYLSLTGVVLIGNSDQILPALKLIVVDAFTGQAMVGGAIGAMIITGVRRAAFSNEAGIGTEAMAHGAARTREPVSEGLVAMLGPVIDTLVVCTCTALVILISGVWTSGDNDGVSLTAAAFASLFDEAGSVVMALTVSVLAFSTVLTFWYYGSKCLGFMIGARHQHHYVWFYLFLIVLGAIASLNTVISVVDTMYALMAIPTMTASLALAPKVNQAARRYFRKDAGGSG